MAEEIEVIINFTMQHHVYIHILKIHDHVSLLTLTKTEYNSLIDEVRFKSFNLVS